MDNDLEIITTADGSHSLLNKRLNETYHSVHGAMQESIHVFIKNGLDFYRQRFQANSVAILEVGFGTGLNALLTLEYAFKNRLDVTYTTLETSPLPKEIWSRLNFCDGQESKQHFKLLHEAPWDSLETVVPGFKLRKVNQSVHDVVVAAGYQVVYFDAFAPGKQPDIWTLPVLERVTAGMTGPGVFATYCARGQLKRDLRSLGLDVQTLAGPPGKKEMVRALKNW
jgi:tRNA U34 5-methylaminomethyl-2-thiouridine-forming methyltransferase MnmC